MPLCLVAGSLLRLGPLGHDVTFLLDLSELRACGFEVGLQLRGFGLSLLPGGRGVALELVILPGGADPGVSENCGSQR
jgi:hypothetical protein